MINTIIFILIIVLILFLLILVLPTHIIVEYNNNLKIKLKVLFIPITIFPLSIDLLNKKTFTPPESSSETKKKRSIKSSETIKSLKIVLNLLISTTKKILKHIKIKDIYLQICVNCEEASDIAIKYGQIQAIVNNIFTRINSFISIKNYKINIYPNFIEGNNNTKFKIDIHSRPIFILYEMLIFALNYAKVSKELNFNNNGE